MREDERAFVCFEGRAYGTPAPADRLFALAAAVGGEPHAAAAALRDGIREWEGEFVALVYLKRVPRLLVLGDPMGRLPLYAVERPGGLTLSRDQRFLVEIEDGVEADRLGIAQLLLFGFPIGHRTLARGVDRLRAGSTLCADREGVRLVAGSWEPEQLESKSEAASAQRLTAELVDRFVHACRIRAAACDPPLVSLSGGLDSRAVAAGLARAGCPFECYTFVDAAGVHGREVAAAQAIALALGAPWRQVDAPAPTGRSLQRVLEMKLGLNSLAMGYSVAVFETLREVFGAGVSFWSGDGGDKMMPDHRPGLGRGDVVRYLVEHRPVWPTAMITRLTGVTERQLRDSVAEVVGGYPERSGDLRFVRFGLAERGARWVYEGEDSNRHYFWTVAPFFDRGFARAALAVPDGQKSGHQLYCSFMRALNPAMVAIPDANLGLRMDAAGYVWSRRLREAGRRFPRLRRWLGQGVAGSVLQPAPALTGAVLRRLLERSQAVRSCFSPAALASVAEAPQRWGHGALDGLLTAVSAVERIAGEQPTLEGFAAERFG